MILGDPRQTIAATAPGSRATLDDLFRRAAQRNPDMLALIDPPNRASFTDGTPRRRTYAQADRMVSAIAGRLRDLGLPLDSVVGIQLPNTVESVLTLLGVLRAGLIAAPLPLLWRHGDLVTALSRVGAKALITCRQVGSTDHAGLAMRAAVDIFPVRYVCAFGSGLPDGVVGLDELYAEENPQPPQLDRARAEDRAAHLAVITWEATADALVPVARNHAEVIAGGLAVLLEGRYETGATFLSAVPPSTFAGLTVSVLPWLITGGTLVLHQAFDPETLARQLRDGCDAAVLPAPVVPRLVDAGFFASNVRTIIGLWRSPERMNNAPAWRQQLTPFIDVACFGETCVIPMRRGASGRPAPLPLGIIAAPRGAPGAVIVAELKPTRDRTLALSGPMVPRTAYPPGAESTALPHFETSDGLVDTGYPCRVDSDRRTLILTGPPVGIAGVGGYRFALRELQRLITDIDSGGHIAALPDALSGQRLAGAADDSGALRSALVRRGVNPLVADAFGA
ncbi:MAG TPA: class I adenylate-forming enzyme family protein [Xanthobacteraceae bacterium]|nr:class I adenylate-forming enzyme family protein [Xanthobacteraceae bacterium]